MRQAIITASDAAVKEKPARVSRRQQCPHCVGLA
jgi:hypothetical protein